MQTMPLQRWPIVPNSTSYLIPELPLRPRSNVISRAENLGNRLPHSGPRRTLLGNEQTASLACSGHIIRSGTERLGATRRSR